MFWGVSMGLKSIYRGDTKKYQFTITDPSTGDPIDISGHYLYFTMKVNEDDTDGNAVLQVRELMPSNANSQNGIGVITVPSTDTDVLEPGTIYFYDFQYVVPGVPPYVQTLQAGKVRVLQDATITNT